MRKYLYNLMQTYLIYLEEKGIASSNQFDNSLGNIQNKLIKFKANPNKKPPLKLARKTINGIQNDNKNIRIPKHNKTALKNKVKPKTSIDELLNQKSNINFSGHSVSNNQKKTNIPIKINSNNISAKTNLIIGEPLNIDVEEYIKTDPNNMDYDNAIKRDQRSFCVYFVDNIKTDLLILNIFWNYEKLNPFNFYYLY